MYWTLEEGLGVGGRGWGGETDRQMVQRKKQIADQASACAQKRLDCFLSFPNTFLTWWFLIFVFMSLSDGVAPCGMSKVLLN